MSSGNTHGEIVCNSRMILILSAIFFLILPAAATLIPAVIKGTVIDLNAQNHTLTILASCTEFECVKILGCGEDYCRVPATGLLKGAVPDESLFTVVRPGDSGSVICADAYSTGDSLDQTIKNYLAPSRHYHSARRCRTFFESKPNDIMVPSKSTLAATIFSTERFYHHFIIRFSLSCFQSVPDERDPVFVKGFLPG